MTIVSDEACPKCREQGRDRTGNHLMVFDNGNKFCNRCGYKEGGDGSIAYRDTPEDRQYINTRGIREEISSVYSARMDGEGNLYFPRTSEGSVVGEKCRRFDKTFVISGAGRTTEFFGHHLLRGTGGKCFITEGEMDALSVAQVLYDNAGPEKTARYGFPPVVSVPDGVTSAKKIFAIHKALLEGYKEIVLVPDSDQAGKALVEAACSILDRSKIRVVNLPSKDANDMLQEGKGEQLAYLCIAKGSIPTPEKLVWGDDIPLEALQKVLQPGLDIPQYPGLTRKLRGVRSGPGGGELWLICSGSGMGKTTMTHEIAYAMRKYHGLTIGQIRLEEKVEKSGQALIAIDNNIPLAELRSNPNALSKEAWEKSRSDLLLGHTVAFLDHFGSLDSNKLVDNFKFLSYSAGCRVIFLDHISMVVSGLESSFGERKDLDVLMTNLSAFVEQSGTTVIAVIHLKRPQGDASYNEGHPITLSSLRGSAGLEQMSHNVVALEGSQSSGDGNQRRSTVLKNREWGDLNHCEDLLYYPSTGRFLSVEYDFDKYK